MSEATNYAVIENGLVVNISWGGCPGAILIGSADVQIGDTYVNGSFFRDGNLINDSEGVENGN